MDGIDILRIRPNMAVLAEAFQEAGWECRVQIREPRQSYRGIRLFHGQPDLKPDVLYLLRPDEESFPVDGFSYICAEPKTGTANHLICPGWPDEQIMDFVLELFSQFQQWEQMIDQLVFRKNGLQELCQLGARLLENPVCIHDDWFMMIAMSQDIEQTMPPEYYSSSKRGFIPRMILDDFRHDSDYLETYAHRDARIWRSSEDTPASLYVNLWDGTVYRGRLLVIQSRRPFKQLDHILAEVLTQRAVLLLRQQYLGEQKTLQSMDDVIYALIQGKQMEPSDLTQLLNMLNWKKNDRFLCIRVKSQENDGKTVMEHVLHSDLFRIFPEGYILFSGSEQCVVLNLSKDTDSGAMIQHRMAPLCRDYCLYVGISSPVADIHDLHLAYYQAQVALDQAFRLRSDRWIVHFAECAMAHMLENLDSTLPTWCLVSPELLTIMDHDRQRGTQYFETFREYLLNERDIPKTSEKLIIHRTTLLYRLKKIQSMMNVNLEDPWQRLYLTLSLWILEQKNK